MPWDDIITAATGNGSVYGAVQYVFAGGNIMGSAYGGSTTSSGILWTNCTTMATGFSIPGNTAGAGGIQFSGTGSPIFDPVQVAGLRQDFRDVKESRKRKRAEIRARKLFKRVVGDIAYQQFKKRGYHEIYGPSGTRYRLEPGRWVLVMKGAADERAYELCAHLEFGVPWFDTMAVQHLMLTSSKESEDQFLKIANKHSVGYYPIDEMQRRAG